MKDRSSREATKYRMKWLAVSIGATLLICPWKSVAQSKTDSAAKHEAVIVVSPSERPDPAEGVKDERQSTIQGGKVVLASARANATAVTSNSDKQSGPETKTVRIWDACDPASFNAAVGPGTCQPGHHGQMNFNDFFAELQLDGIAGAWRFNPLLNTSDGKFKLVQLELEPNDRISLQNLGGETHTFTRVEEFGGGYFAPLNPLTGNPEPAPECAQVRADGSLAPQPETDTNQFVEAGTTEVGPIAGTRTLPFGITHWQCCVHPWMRMNIVVRDHDHDHDHQQ